MIIVIREQMKGAESPLEEERHLPSCSDGDIVFLLPCGRRPRNLHQAAHEHCWREKRGVLGLIYCVRFLWNRGSDGRRSRRQTTSHVKFCLESLGDFPRDLRYQFCPVGKHLTFRHRYKRLMKHVIQGACYSSDGSNQERPAEYPSSTR